MFSSFGTTAPTVVGGVKARVPLVIASPNPRCQVCVIVPARDEARLLPATLAALAQQLDLRGKALDPRRYEVLVLANNCRDDTAAVVRHSARRFPTLALHLVERELPAPLAHVGTARRLLMDEACERLLALGRPRGLIASTDADTRVGPTWVAAMLAELERGTDLIGGDILAQSVTSDTLNQGALGLYLADSCYQRLVSAYETLLDPQAVDPWPRHQHHTGASLAVTPESYRRVGGLPVLRSGEDVALVEALYRAGARIRHSPLVRVATSIRTRGRAPAGMAATLCNWSHLAQANQTLLVEPRQTIEARQRVRRSLRALWRLSRQPGTLPVEPLRRLAAQLQLDHVWLEHEIYAASSSGELEERAYLHSPALACDVARPVEIDAAVRDLYRQLGRWGGWRDPMVEQLLGTLAVMKAQNNV